MVFKKQYLRHFNLCNNGASAICSATTCASLRETDGAYRTANVPLICAEKIPPTSLQLFGLRPGFKVLPAMPNETAHPRPRTL